MNIYSLTLYFTGSVILLISLFLFIYHLRRDTSLMRSLYWLLAGVALCCILVWIGIVYANQDQLRNTTPSRTFRVDAVVGHGNDSYTQPTSFEVVCNTDQIIITEMKAGDPLNNIEYTIPFQKTCAEDLPVSLIFYDVNGDKARDMEITIHDGSQEHSFLFINVPEEDRFKPA